MQFKVKDVCKYCMQEKDHRPLSLARASLLSCIKAYKQGSG